MKKFARLNWCIFLIITVVLCKCTVLNKQQFKAYKQYAVKFQTNDSVLNRLAKEYELLLLYNGIDHHRSINKQYYMLGLKNKEWYKIVYDYKKKYSLVGEPPYVFSVDSFSKKSGDSVLSVFTDNLFWEIKNVDNGCEQSEYKTNIRCGTGTGPSDEVDMLYKNYFIPKTYHYSEYFEANCCPGNKDRQVFIKCLNALKATKNK